MDYPSYILFLPAGLILILAGIFLRGRLTKPAVRRFAIGVLIFLLMAGISFFLMKQAEHFRYNYQNSRNVSFLLLSPFLETGEFLSNRLPAIMGEISKTVFTIHQWTLLHQKIILQVCLIGIPSLAILLLILKLWVFKRWRNPLPIFLVSLSLLLGIIAIIFSKQHTVIPALIFTGGAVIITAIYALVPFRKLSRTGISARWALFMICAVFIISLMLRTYQLYHTSARYDNWEAVYGREGIKTLDGNFPTALWQDTSWRGLGHTGHFSAVYLYLHGIFFRIFGPNLVASRLISALCGALTVFLVYLLFKLLFNPPVALITAALLAFSPIHLNFTRTTNLVSISIMTGVLILYLLFRAIKLNHPSTYFWLGIVFSFMGFVYEPIMIFFPLSCFFILVYLLFQKGFLRRNWFGIILMFAAIYLVIGFLNIPVWGRMFPKLFVNESVWHRTATHQYTVKADYFRAIPLIGENIWKLFLSFVRDGKFNYDIWPRGNMYFNPLLTVLCFWGIVYSLFNLKKTNFRIVIFISAIFFPPNVLSRPPVIVRRLLFMIPLLYFFAALPLYCLWKELTGFFPGQGKKIGLVLLLIIIVLIGSYNSNIYFNSRASAGRWEKERFFDEYAKQYIGEYYLYIIPLKGNSRTTIDFLLWEKIESGRTGDYYRYISSKDIPGLIANAGQAEKPVVFICHPAKVQRKKLESIARDPGKRARIEEHRDRFGQLIAYALFIEAAAPPPASGESPALETDQEPLLEDTP
ncbi:MAG: glycosyltransferase family 39 protein [Candidatus Auribacterota bacterium]|nr:glycosyltransferase family 39 protein [Candidatus Auribacterota bacterium]